MLSQQSGSGTGRLGRYERHLIERHDACDAAVATLHWACEAYVRCDSEGTVKYDARLITSPPPEGRGR